MVVDTLREEHRNIARLLRALEHQVAIFSNADAPDYDVIVGVADYFLDYPDRCHHPKEDASTQYPGPSRTSSGQLPMSCGQPPDQERRIN